MDSTSKLWIGLVEQLRSLPFDAQTGRRPVTFGPGLTDLEVFAVEKKFGFQFPPDLRSFLQTALPLGPRFPNWRSGDELELKDWLDLPRQGLRFDVEHNRFWLEEWGARPKSMDAALARLDELLATAPKLIPIYAHRMIPAEPNESGNPVFSVHQTDIIYYGFNLNDYLRAEFAIDREPWPETLRPIRFWDIARFQDVRWGQGPVIFDNR